MTTNDSTSGSVSGRTEGNHLVKLEENLAKIEDLTQRLLGAMAHRRHVPPALQGPSSDLYVKAGAAYMAEMMNNPAKLIEQQIGYWGKTVKHYVEAQQALGQGAAGRPA
jgi:polyhydroxyalkanoate synthase subunit PhaC